MEGERERERKDHSQWAVGDHTTCLVHYPKESSVSHY